jgi:hypothetical protein
MLTNFAEKTCYHLKALTEDGNKMKAATVGKQLKDDGNNEDHVKVVNIRG